MTGTATKRAATDWLDRWLDLVDTSMSDWSEAWREAVRSAGQPWWERAYRPRRCEPVDCDDPTHDCRCECCVGDADLVLEGRVGEVRVVPVEVENRTRRETRVRVAAGEFHGGAGSPPVTATVQPDDEMTLGPCQSKDVLLRLEIGRARQGERGDVDRCEVVYGDIQLVGCDRRPLRVAVAVLPRDCEPLTVDCRSCC